MGWFDLKIISRHFDVPQAKDIDYYVQHGGYAAARQAVRMDPAAITAEIKDFNLRGRGGAGWSP